jgi:hypothetical protein
MKATTYFKLDKDVDTTESEAVEIPNWARYAAVSIPDISAGAVTMKFLPKKGATAALLLPTNNTGWVPIQVAIDSVAELKEVMPTGDDPTVVIITPFIRGLGEGYIRFTCAGAQGALSLWSVMFSD